ncbi:hypothetical protein M231_02672 [Tremella mesenterica]|uniref:Transcription factor TFIIIC triple barrel domain-containing protein n=1 Tax=Tremella mesenterica TaxID=5217 RepID=A0A4Q1BQE7_TREME|nr:hypothetical protein M231_02672 [Tremella mesenterica]
MLQSSDQAQRVLDEKSSLLGEGWKAVESFDDLSDASDFSDYEEEMYVTIDLGSSVDVKSLQTESNYQLIGMDTPLPFLKVGNQIYQGEITPLIGDEIIFTLVRDPDQPSKPSHPPLAISSQRLSFRSITLVPHSEALPPEVQPKIEPQTQAEEFSTPGPEDPEARKERLKAKASHYTIRPIFALPHSGGRVYPGRNKGKSGTAASSVASKSVDRETPGRLDQDQEIAQNEDPAGETGVENPLFGGVTMEKGSSGETAGDDAEMVSLDLAVGDTPTAISTPRLSAPPIPAITDVVNEDMERMDLDPPRNMEVDDMDHEIVDVDDSDVPERTTVQEESSTPVASTSAVRLTKTKKSTKVGRMIIYDMEDLFTIDLNTLNDKSRLELLDQPIQPHDIMGGDAPMAIREFTKKQIMKLRAGLPIDALGRNGRGRGGKKHVVARVSKGKSKKQLTQIESGVLDELAKLGNPSEFESQNPELPDVGLDGSAEIMGQNMGSEEGEEGERYQGKGKGKEREIVQIDRGKGKDVAERDFFFVGGKEEVERERKAKQKERQQGEETND